MINLLRLFFLNGHSCILFLIRGNPTSRKAYFMGPSERVKLRLFQALIRDARHDSNSRPSVQISSPLPSRNAHEDLYY